MLSQYGVRMYSADFKQMKWDEFSSLLRGISANSPLGNLVQIRSETDPEIINRFTPAQKRIHDDWARKHKKTLNSQSHKQFLAEIQSYFAGLG